MKLSQIAFRYAKRTFATPATLRKDDGMVGTVGA
jgi:hypothetical protein